MCWKNYRMHCSELWISLLSDFEFIFCIMTLLWAVSMAMNWPSLVNLASFIQSISSHLCTTLNLNKKWLNYSFENVILLIKFTFCHELFQWDWNWLLLYSSLQKWLHHHDWPINECREFWHLWTSLNFQVTGSIGYHRDWGSHHSLHQNIKMLRFKFSKKFIIILKLPSSKKWGPTVFKAVTWVWSCNFSIVFNWFIF